MDSIDFLNKKLYGLIWHQSTLSIQAELERQKGFDRACKRGHGFLNLVKKVTHGSDATKDLGVRFWDAMQPISTIKQGGDSLEQYFKKFKIELPLAETEGVLLNEHFRPKPQGEAPSTGGTTTPAAPVVATIASQVYFLH